jgi:hypothetical protein
VHIPVEISIDLTAQELLAPPALDAMVEVEDICDVDPLLRTGAFVANSDQATANDDASADDSVEIELTAEQMDAMLDGTS